MRLADLERGSKTPGDCGSPPDKPPDWLDMEMFKRGQQLYMRHLFPMTTILQYYLVLGFSLPTLLDALVFTKQSHTPKKSYKRYLLTLNYLIMWHTGNVWQPGSAAFKSVQDVRKMHNRVSKSMNDSNNATAETLFFSQYDMTLVQCAFIGGVVMYPKEFGVNCTISDLEDYIHFWRGIGYLLGIEDKYNLCKGIYSETVRICKDIEEKLCNHFHNLPKDFSMMANAYCEGYKMLVNLPIASVTAIHGFCYYFLTNKLPVPSLGIADWLRLFLTRFILSLCWWFPTFEAYLGKQVLTILKAAMKRLKHTD